MSETVDLLVAGAGITGLYVATRYLKKHPEHRVVVVERNSYLGGRIYTHHQHVKGKGLYQWEAGAGRIPVTHARVIGLIKEYGLTFQRWEAPPNLDDPFPDLIPTYLAPLHSLSPSVLGQHTLGELLRKIHGPIEANRVIKLFPYWAEFQTLRADLALKTFLEGPLNEKHGWGGCAEGLSSIVERMGADVEARGGKIHLQTSVVHVDSENMSCDIKKEETLTRIYAKKIVMALDATSLGKVKGVVEHVPALRRLKAEPLLRVYAVFKTHQDKSWFSGMAKQVFPDSPIRFFIPMNAERGLAMISYTEGRDAEYWMAMPEEKRKKEMMTELRRLFPEMDVPDPLFVKFHYWKTGCTYWTPARGAAATTKENWLPGRYDPYELSEQSIQPIPSRAMYFCNESFSTDQSWMESGLVQAEKVLTKLLRRNDSV